MTGFASVGMFEVNRIDVPGIEMIQRPAAANR